MQHVPLPNPHLCSSATYSEDKCSHEICLMLLTEVGYCLATNWRKDHSTIHHHKCHTSQQQLLLYQGNGISWSACCHLQWPSVLDNEVQHYHCSFSIVCVIVQQYTRLFMLIKCNEIIVVYTYAMILLIGETLMLSIKIIFKMCKLLCTCTWWFLVLTSRFPSILMF